jgi:hypothetical protein
MLFAGLNSRPYFKGGEGMIYAIETLEIEANKLKEIIRIEERYSAYPEYKYSEIEFKERLITILNAIDILKKNNNS